MNSFVKQISLAIAGELYGDEETLERAARAAIAGMEPLTDKMCRAAIETGAVDNDGYHIQPDHIRTLMGAMVEEALKK